MKIKEASAADYDAWKTRVPGESYPKRVMRFACVTPRRKSTEKKANQLEK